MSWSTLYFEPFYSLAEFNHLFDDAFASRTSQGGNNQIAPRANDEVQAFSRTWRPKMDLHENAEANTLTATFELPGLRKEDVQIDVANDRITISGESSTTTTTPSASGSAQPNDVSSENQLQYAVRERRWGKFSRTLPLPRGVKLEEIKASMEHGVLTVTFPKTAPEQAPQRVSIA